MHDKPLSEEIDDAIDASNNLLHYIYDGQWEKVNEINNTRIKLIRRLSTCQKNESFWQEFGAKLIKIRDLDKLIMENINQIHEQTLQFIFTNQVKKNACIQYLDNRI